MLELFCTFIVIFFPVCLYLFICFLGKFKIYIEIIFIYEITFQFILSCILLSNNFYKKTIFWKNKDFTFRHYLPWDIIKNITINKTEHFYGINYTLEKTDVYEKECLTNFFISDNICPITQIIVENRKIDEYTNYREIQLDNNLYLYFSTDIKNGSFYQKINNYSNTTELSEKKYNLTEFNMKEKLKEKEIMEKIRDLKKYTDYSDILCFALIFISIPLIVMICIYYSILYYIVTLVFQLTIIVLYILRYYKFTQLKEIFIINKNLILLQYTNKIDNEYFPNDFFNIDSFPLAVQISIILALLLYTPIFKKCFDFDFENHYKKYFMMVFFYSLSFGSIIFLTLEKINDNKIKKNYNNIFSEWYIPPIKSIRIGNDSSYYPLESLELGSTVNKIFNKWKNISFVVEKLDFHQLFIIRKVVPQIKFAEKIDLEIIYISL